MSKQSDYSERDMSTLGILADSIWQLIRRQRQDRTIETLSSAIAQSPNAVIITDLNGDIEYANEPLCAPAAISWARWSGKTRDCCNQAKPPSRSMPICGHGWSRARPGRLPPVDR